MLPSSTLPSFSECLRFSLAIASLMVGLWLMEEYFGFDFTYLGISPRSLQGLPGILFSPFIHGSFRHLLANTPMLVVLLVSTFFFYPALASRTLLIVYFLTGFSVWLFARPAYHIGASGVVYGLAGFLFFSGVFRKDMRSLLLAILIAVLNGGMLYGLFPYQRGVSWESHLFGAMAGGVAAFLLRKVPGRQEPDEMQAAQGAISLSDLEDGYRNIEGEGYKYTYLPRDKTIE